MAMLGYIVSPWAVLCWPAAVLISLAFAAAGMAGTTYMRTWQDFDMVSLAFIPLFLFSATFYPITVYPGWLQAVVRCTPKNLGITFLLLLRETAQRELLGARAKQVLAEQRGATARSVKRLLALVKKERG